MNTSMLKSMREEKGFTLVELAVVMIIIGLLIGGILKGQEMIANAQITSTVAQAKAIDAASSTFRDQYDAFPGDMSNAQVRIPGCTAAPCLNGDGNSKLTAAVGTVPVLGTENTSFFPMLRLASLLSGYDGTNNLGFGQTFPTSSVGGGYTVGYTDATLAATGFANLRQGHYIVLTAAPAAVAAGSGKINPSQAARIDRKMDDGQATTGAIVLDNVNANCLLGTAYAEQQTGETCNIAIRIQN